MVFLDKNSKKKVYQVLNEMLGLGNSNAKFLCQKFGFQQKCTLNNLDSFELEQLKNYLSSNYILDKVLINKMNQDVKKKIDLGTYEGKRHNLGYPVRGQRTLSNGKTQRNLHKFRFYYKSDIFNHVYFKNQQKGLKRKKTRKINERTQNRQNFKAKAVFNYGSKSFFSEKGKANVRKPVKKQTKKKDSYFKKLEKIKAERQLQIDRKFQKDHANAMKTHPYFLNIMRNKAKKNKKK